MTQISLKTIRDRHATAAWVPPPVYFSVMCMIDNAALGSTNAFSRFKDPALPDYKRVNASASPLHIEWVQGQERRVYQVNISANCAWRIHQGDTTMGLVNIRETHAHIHLDNNVLYGIKGGNGYIRLSVDPLFELDTGQLVVEHANPDSGTGYSKIIITLEKNIPGIADDFYVVPNMFTLDGNYHPSLSATIYTGSSTATPSILGSPVWMTNWNIAHDPLSPPGNNQWNLTFNVLDFVGLCPAMPRRTIIELQSNDFGYNLEIDVYQTIKIQGDGEVEDYEGNVYPFKIINGYRVMLTNLRTQYYGDGTMISQHTGNPPQIPWEDVRDPAWCYYNNNSWYDDKYGKLYNGYVVDNDQMNMHFGLLDMNHYLGAGWPSPYEWHVPTYSEMHTILGAPDSTKGYRNKCNSNLPLWHPRWDIDNVSDNSTGFSALPGGHRNWIDGRFKGLGHAARFWLDEVIFSSKYSVRFYGPGEGVIFLLTDQTVPGALRRVRLWHGCSVRLVQEIV